MPLFAATTTFFGSRKGKSRAEDGAASMPNVAHSLGVDGERLAGSALVGPDRKVFDRSNQGEDVGGSLVDVSTNGIGVVEGVGPRQG